MPPRLWTLAALAFAAWLPFAPRLHGGDHAWEIRTSPDGAVMWCRWAEPYESVWWLIATDDARTKGGRLAHPIAAVPVDCNEFGVWRLELASWPQTYHQFARRKGGLWSLTAVQEMTR